MKALQVAIGASVFILGAATCIVMSMPNEELKPSVQKLAPIVKPTVKSNFDEAIKVVFKHEGYYSNDKDDPGGETKYGISLRFLKNERIDIDGDGDSDADDIKALTKTDADKIYFRKFWERNHYDALVEPAIATKMLDLAVNVGASRANKILKDSVNMFIDEQIPVDGILDKETIEIVNYIQPDELLNEIRLNQIAFYKGLVAKNPKLSKFLNGWLARAVA